MNEVEMVKKKLDELKHKAWGSTRFGPPYSRGYWVGVFETCRELEKILGIEIEIDPEKAEKMWNEK